jgi:hypothetical protein
VPKDAIVDSLFSFLSHKEHIQNALGWIESNKITVGDASLYELKPAHKHRILRCLFMSRHFEHDTKMEMMEMIFADDKSDIVDRCRAACMASLPNPDNKAKVWAEITDPNNTDSLYVRQAKMNGFYGHDQHDIVKDYFEKFYEILPIMHKNSTHKKFDSFFNTMLPRSGEIKDEHIVKLMCLK